MAATWMYEIRSAKGRILSGGTYPARPWASARDIADEQLAIYLGHCATPVQQRWPTSQPSVVWARVARGVVCKAWRQDDPDTVGESRGDDWIQAAALPS